jgi:hypothetical protein
MLSGRRRRSKSRSCSWSYPCTCMFPCVRACIRVCLCGCVFHFVSEICACVHARVAGVAEQAAQQLTWRLSAAATRPETKSFISPARTTAPASASMPSGFAACVRRGQQRTLVQHQRTRLALGFVAHFEPLLKLLLCPRLLRAYSPHGRRELDCARHPYKRSRLRGRPVTQGEKRRATA